VFTFQSLIHFIIRFISFSISCGLFFHFTCNIFCNILYGSSCHNFCNQVDIPFQAKPNHTLAVAHNQPAVIDGSHFDTILNFSASVPHCKALGITKDKKLATLGLFFNTSNHFIQADNFSNFHIFVQGIRVNHTSAASSHTLVDISSLFKL
jgi:hypothetical protein